MANSDEARGLYDKYDVKRKNDQSGKHATCRYFVLDPQHDPLAVVALRAYADAAATAGYAALAQDLSSWARRSALINAATTGDTDD